MEQASRRDTSFVLAAVLVCALAEAGEAPNALTVETARKLIAELGPQKAAEQVSRRGSTPRSFGDSSPRPRR
jgi:hypothetical protein